MMSSSHGDDGVRAAPPRVNVRPSTTMQRRPVKPVVSMMTGAACGLEAAPPIPTPPGEGGAWRPICRARADRGHVSTIVPVSRRRRCSHRRYRDGSGAMLQAPSKRATAWGAHLPSSSCSHVWGNSHLSYHSSSASILRIGWIDESHGLLDSRSLTFHSLLAGSAGSAVRSCPLSTVPTCPAQPAAWLAGF